MSLSCGSSILVGGVEVFHWEAELLSGNAIRVNKEMGIKNESDPAVF